MGRENKGAGNKTTGPDEVQQLAQKLVDWAQKLPEEQQALLKRLLSRAESHEITIGQDRYLIEPSVEQVVMDALASFKSLNLPGLSWVKNWPLSPPWPRGKF